MCCQRAWVGSSCRAIRCWYGVWFSVPVYDRRSAVLSVGVLCGAPRFKQDPASRLQEVEDEIERVRALQASFRVPKAGPAPNDDDAQVIIIKCDFLAYVPTPARPEPSRSIRFRSPPQDAVRWNARLFEGGYASFHSPAPYSLAHVRPAFSRCQTILMQEGARDGTEGGYGEDG